MRNTHLHDRLQAFAAGAAEVLQASVESGHEIPFEVAERPGQTSVLYSYKPLSDRFVRERFGELRRLSEFSPALLALAKVDGISAYLRVLGISYVPTQERDRAEAALREFVARVFEEASSFELDERRFEHAYKELETVVYENAIVNTVLAPVLGVRLEAERWDLGAGIELVRGDLCDAPPEAVWSPGCEEHEPNTIVALRLEATPKDPPPLAGARLVFRKLLTTLRLLRRGGAALGPTAWWRLDDGPWQTFPLGHGGRVRAGEYVLAEPDREELTDLFELVRLRPLADGALPWALARFEMGCEHVFPLDGLTDHLLAVRALLDGEDTSPASPSLRLAALCAEPGERVELEARVRQAFQLERLVMRGELDVAALESIGARSADVVAAELEKHLRAILRDMVCGYLDADVRRIADDLLLAESAAKPEPRIEARTGVRSGARRRKQPHVEAWDEIVPDDEEQPEAEDPPEPEFVPPGRARRARAATRKSGLFERTDGGRKRSRRRTKPSEQKTEETIAVGGFDWHRDIADWGFDDDPDDFSAAV